MDPEAEKPKHRCIQQLYQAKQTLHLYRRAQHRFVQSCQVVGVPESNSQAQLDQRCYSLKISYSLFVFNKYRFSKTEFCELVHLGGGITLAVAVATTLVLVLRAAAASPVESLHRE